MLASYFTGSLGTITNRETWSQTCRVEDRNHADVNIAAATIALSVRKQNTDGSADLEASVGDGITVSTPNFTWTFTAEEMHDLEPGTYDVGCTVTTGGITRTVIRGTVAIEDGIVD